MHICYSFWLDLYYYVWYLSDLFINHSMARRNNGTDGIFPTFHILYLYWKPKRCLVDNLFLMLII